MRRTGVVVKKNLIWRNTVGIELSLDGERAYLFLRQGYDGCMPMPENIMWGLIDQNLKSPYCFDVLKAFKNEKLRRIVGTCSRVEEVKYIDYNGGISAKF